MNKKPNCPRCASSSVIKSGKIKGKQRHRCKQCGLQFTRLTPRGRPATEKATAIILYSLGLSMNAIAKFLKVSVPAVLYWIRDFAQKHGEKPRPSGAIVVELDEMWHFLNSKKTNLDMESLLQGDRAAHWLAMRLPRKKNIPDLVESFVKMEG